MISFLKYFGRKQRHTIRNLNKKRTCKLPYFGVGVHHYRGDGLATRAVKEGIFESEVVKTIRDFLEPGDTYFDIGANIGLMSVPFLGVEDIEIHSIEPGPGTFQCLQRTAEGAPTKLQSRWHIHEQALGKENGVVEFHTGDQSTSALAGLKNTGRINAGTCQVKVSTLDDFWEQIGRPEVSFIKIDVEGGEIDVLSGGRKCLENTHPPILMEIDPANYPAYGLTDFKIFSQIEDLGYRLFFLPDWESNKPRYYQICSPEAFRLALRSEINYLLLPAEMNR